jgi:hypothetical protein
MSLSHTIVKSGLMNFRKSLETDRNNVNDTLKQRIRCQLSNP